MYEISFYKVTNLFILKFQQGKKGSNPPLAHCCGLDACVLPKAYTEIPLTNVMMVGAGAIGK